MAWLFFRRAALAFALVLPLLSQSAPGDASGTVKQRISHVRDLGKRDTSALADLAPYLHDSDRDVRLEAIKAVVRIDTKASLDALIAGTRDSDPEIHIRATDGIVNTYLPGYLANNSLSGNFTRGFRQIKGFFSERNDQVVDADVVIRPDVAQALADEINDGIGLDASSNAALAAGILRPTRCSRFGERVEVQGQPDDLRMPGCAAEDSGSFRRTGGRFPVARSG